jgi:hypothetical protein
MPCGVDPGATVFDTFPCRGGAVLQGRQQEGELVGQAEDPAWYAQMATVPLPPCDRLRLKQRLYDEFGIEIPVLAWHDRPAIRVSVQGYNTRADLEQGEQLR